ncbi:uncharacterized protein PolD2 [Diabrotica undecimpunctata]|uniref:uncharacterized protein PolD2 n=1 Tax=Diabrotica undecimpunctata TaxID=50387 RepID=UPI003B63F5FF
MPEKMETERPSLKYQNVSEKYAEQPEDYNRQYCSIYLARLNEMEIILKNSIRHKWGDTYPIIKLHKLTEEDKDKCIVIGTIFKDQKLKPSILKELSEANQLVAETNPIINNNFTDDSDKLFIEDEVQRYEIDGVPLSDVVTGITIALLGSDAGKGKFIAEDYVFAGLREQIEKPLLQEDNYVVFLSGLDLINCEKIMWNLELLTFWLSGMLNDESVVPKIARIIIAGNSVRIHSEKRKPTISLISRVAETDESVEAVKAFDNFLSQICGLVEVDVMPGENDPSNQILPQKQMHHCMFPNSATYKSLHLVPNPYACSLENINILGTSGQPVQHVMWYSENNTPIQALEKCLEWGHIAPTAPDTLGCYPYYKNDPFIIEKCPHVFFAGNQDEFSTKLIEGVQGQKVRLISIPKFCASHQAVLLNLKNLECTTKIFDTL